MEIRIIIVIIITIIIIISLSLLLLLKVIFRRCHSSVPHFRSDNT